MVEMGRFRTRELVEVVMLKILPAVPVETLVMRLLINRLVVDRFLLASVTTKEEAVKVAMLTLPVPMLKPLAVEKVKLEEVARGEVPLPNRMSLAVTAVLPVPPLPTGRVPLTSEELRLTAEELNNPPAEEWTRPNPRLFRTTAPEAVKLPLTPKVAPGVVEPIPTFPKAPTVKKGVVEVEEEATWKIGRD